MKILFTLLLMFSPALSSADTKSIESEQALEKFKSIAKSIPYEALEEIPVQDHGRIKPFDTYAREAALFICGKYKYEGLNPIQLYFALMIAEHINNVELINVRDTNLRVKLGYPKDKRYFSMQELEASPLEQLAEPISKRIQQGDKSVTQDEKKINEAYEQLYVVRSIRDGGPLFNALILNPSKDHTTDTTALAPVFVTMKNILNSMVQGDPSQVSTLASYLIDLSHKQDVPDLFKPYLNKISTEVLFNKLHIFFIAGILYMLVGAFLVTGLAQKLISKKVQIVFILVPLVLHITGFALRVYLTGFAPVTNMYGTMVWVSFGVVLFGGVLFFLYSNSLVYGLLLMGASATLILTESIPLILSPDLDPIVAVLRNNFWLSIHVLTITISYAALTASMLIGNSALIKSIRNRSKPFQDSEYRDLAHYNYRMIQLGVFLLTTGIILGGWWADYSWGRFWGWDPKETWALIADLGFLSILHARYVGWLGSFGILATAPIAYLLVIMAWYGVNFILASGLHSYGFSSGGAQIVAIFVTLQLLLFAVSMYFNSKRVLTRVL